jgi:DNA modification methylase
MVALALQADGWWVRSVICWAKKSCMPESVTDRPTNSWEPIFLLAKNRRYFYDATAVREPAEAPAVSEKRSGMRSSDLETFGLTRGKSNPSCSHPDGKNQRNVWSLGPEPYAEAHFATFPTEIPRRAILAGTSARGCCPQCRAPWVRVVEKGETKNRTARNGQGNGELGAGLRFGDAETRTVGWEPGCQHGEDPSETRSPIPCTVLDPFGGSGTTGMVALELGRKAILCELSEKYAKLIATRTHVTPGLQLA